MSQSQTLRAMVLRYFALVACAALGACGDLARLPPGAGEPAPFASGAFIGEHGALLVADDVGNVVWRVARAR